MVADPQLPCRCVPFQIDRLEFGFRIGLCERSQSTAAARRGFPAGRYACHGQLTRGTIPWTKRQLRRTGRPLNQVFFRYHLQGRTIVRLTLRRSDRHVKNRSSDYRMVRTMVVLSNSSFKARVRASTTCSESRRCKAFKKYKFCC